MNLVFQRIQALHSLRNQLNSISEDEFLDLQQRMQNENPWFDAPNVKKAIQGIIFLLEENTLNEFSSKNEFSEVKDLALGLVLAGNLPAVGFHDILIGFLTCKEVHVKLSSSDRILILYIIQIIKNNFPEFEAVIQIKERLELSVLSGIIATGSDNTSRYFETYFSSLPNIIRKNRVSVAVLNQEVTDDELLHLGDDIFTYFGLGCRNVSKIFVPKDFDLTRILRQMDKFQSVGYHHKFANNYDYNRSVYLVNKEPHLDNGFLMLKESKELVSPLSVIFYEYYDSMEEVSETLDKFKDKIQVIVSNFLPHCQKLGEAQMPSLYDFPDNINVVEFIKNLNAIEVKN